MFTDTVDTLVTMTDTDVLERFRSLELQRRELEAEQALMVSAMGARSIASKVDGHRSLNALLRAELNCSTAEAAMLRSLGRAVNDLDGVGEAWMSGRIGRSQVAVLATARANPRVGRLLGPFVPTLVEQAEILDAADFKCLVDYTVKKLDVEGSHDDRDSAYEHRNAHVSTVGDGVAVNASGGDPLAAEEMVEIFDEFVETEFDNDVDARKTTHGDNAEMHDLARTGNKRRHDALLAIFRAAAASKQPGEPASTVVNIVVDAATFAHATFEAGLATDTNLAGEAVDPFTGIARPNDLLDDIRLDPASILNRRCETSSGVQLHTHDVLRAALSGHVRRVVVDSDGVVVNMGRKHRLYTGSARDAAKMLIRRCEHPGCRLPVKFCDVDHNDEWDAHDGATTQANSKIRCNPHNRAKTKHAWRSRRAVNGHDYTVRADGTIMLPIGARSPTFPDGANADDVLDHRVEDITWDDLVTRIEYHTVAHLVAQRGR